MMKRAAVLFLLNIIFLFGIFIQVEAKNMYEINSEITILYINYDGRISFDLELKNNNYSLFDTIPIYKKKFFGLGAHIGIGTGMDYGTFGNHYKQTRSMSGGGDLFFGKSSLTFDITSIKHDIKEVYIGTQTFEEEAGIDVINISYGYSIIDKEHFRLTPFAGGAHLSLLTNNSLNVELTETDNNLFFGLNTSYKFRNKLKHASKSIILVNRFTTSMIQAKILAAKVNFYDDFEGWMLNFSVQIAWQVNRTVIID